jgi:ABC-type bacteriocin/lantibiotic exporter with double-glycine peptidase domain
MRFHRLFPGAGVLLCLCGIGLAAAASGAPASSVWLDVPFIKQEKNGCGAASIAMVMQYWHQQAGETVDESSNVAYIERALYSRKARGIYASEMESYFGKHHFHAYIFRGEWHDLEEHLAKGRPLIVALKPRSGERTLHYVVVVGVDGQQNVVLVNDAAQRKLLKVDRATFLKEWNAVNDWTLLAMPDRQE